MYTESGGIFELFNIIASKLDQIHGQVGYGEKVIKDCLEEFDRVIEERQKQKQDSSKWSSSKLNK